MPRTNAKLPDPKHGLGPGSSSLISPNKHPTRGLQGQPGEVARIGALTLGVGSARGVSMNNWYGQLSGCQAL